MTLEDLHIKLKELGLSLSLDVDEKLMSVGNPNFANPLMWFNPTVSNNEYHGTLQIKSINSKLFSAKQIKYSLILIDTFLRTPLEHREILGDDC